MNAARDSFTITGIAAGNAGYSLAPSRTIALRVAKAQATWVAEPAKHHDIHSLREAKTLRNPAFAKFAQNRLRDLQHLIRLRTISSRRAAAFRRVDDPEVGHDAFQNALQGGSIDLLRFAERLTPFAKVEAPQIDRGSEAFWKIGRKNHRIK